MKIKPFLLTLLSSVYLLTGCSSVPTTPTGFEKKIVESEKLNFVIWEKAGIQPQETLRFYIEGNGNPNPKKPIALSLAKEDSYNNIIVLTRPCQYVQNKICQNTDIWKTERYNPEIIEQIQEVITFFIKKHKAKNIEFVAYSDAAPIAFILAQRLGGTKKIITIAGVLDIDSYAKQNDLPSFKNAQNLTGMKNFVAQIPQIHYIGSEDTVVTRSMTERFISKLNNPKDITLKIVHGFDHQDWDNITLKY